MNSDNLSDLSHAFDAAFIYPIAAYRWNTKRARSHWIDLEHWRDALAGPIWAIVKKGECAYVYTRDDEYFAGVNEPAALRARLRQWHDKLIAGLERFQAASPAEVADLASMQQLVCAMWAVAERACDFEQARWEAGRHIDSQI
jgi:hypothetical protein